MKFNDNTLVVVENFSYLGIRLMKICNTSIFIMNARILLYLHMGVYSFAWVVIIKYHRLGGLNNNLFSHGSGD